MLIILREGCFLVASFLGYDGKLVVPAFTWTAGGETKDGWKKLFGGMLACGFPKSGFVFNSDEGTGMKEAMRECFTDIECNSCIEHAKRHFGDLCRKNRFDTQSLRRLTNLFFISIYSYEQVR